MDKTFEDLGKQMILKKKAVLGFSEKDDKEAAVGLRENVTTRAATSMTSAKEEELAWKAAEEQRRQEAAAR